jgi:hypothetical protein
MDVTLILITGIAVVTGMGLICWINSVLTKVDEDMLASAAIKHMKSEPQDGANTLHINPADWHPAILGFAIAETARQSHLHSARHTMAVFLLNSKSRGPIGKRPPTPPRLGLTPVAATTDGHPLGAGVLSPHERGESCPASATAPEAVMTQAKRDIDSGLVDTDARATPGMDAKLRAVLVSGPGGRPPSSGA